MKTSRSLLFARYSIVFSLYCIFSATTSVAASVPEICTSAATDTCCYETCLGMARIKKRIHGVPSAKLRCKKKCMDQ